MSVKDDKPAKMNLQMLYHIYSRISRFFWVGKGEFPEALRLIRAIVPIKEYEHRSLIMALYLMVISTKFELFVFLDEWGVIISLNLQDF